MRPDTTPVTTPATVPSPPAPAARAIPRGLALALLGLLAACATPGTGGNSGPSQQAELGTSGPYAIRWLGYPGGSTRCMAFRQGRLTDGTEAATSFSVHRTAENAAFFLLMNSSSRGHPWLTAATDATLVFAGGQTYRVRVTPVSQATLMAVMPLAAIPAWQAGTRATLAVGGQALTFDQTGVGPAIGAVLDCDRAREVIARGSGAPGQAPRQAVGRDMPKDALTPDVARVLLP